MLVLALALSSALPTVGISVEAQVGSWQPLEVADVAKIIGGEALEVLSAPGLAQLERKDLAGADYRVEVLGRLLDEAETHTIYLSFGPNKRDDLPSFRVSDTVALGKLDRRAMVARITESARRAAGQLLALLKPALAGAGGARPSAEPPKAPPEAPWRWPEVVIPRESVGAHDLFAASSEARQVALRVHASGLREGASASRHALERCALEHKDAELRRGCLVALRPASRAVGTTQRVVIEVLRREKDDRVRAEADEQLQYYSGAARGEAIQAWLEQAALGKVSGALGPLGDVPNLDAVIHRCMVSCGKREKYQRGKRACLELIDPLTYPRRRAVLWPFLVETDAESPYYLEGAGEREGSTGTDWQWAAEAILDSSPEWDPALEDVLWRRYQRSLSSFALDALAGYGAPSARLVDRLLEAAQTGGHHGVLWGLRRMAEKDPSLAPRVKDGLAMMLKTGNYPKTLDRRALEEAVKKL